MSTDQSRLGMFNNTMMHEKSALERSIDVPGVQSTARIKKLEGLVETLSDRNDHLVNREKVLLKIAKG